MGYEVIKAEEFLGRAKEGMYVKLGQPNQIGDGEFVTGSYEDKRIIYCTVIKNERRKELDRLLEIQNYKLEE